LESAAYSAIGEHLQKPHNAGSRPQAQFFNTLLKFFPASADIPTGSNPAEHQRIHAGRISGNAAYDKDFERRSA
jgi:hypothetical protein